MRKGVLDLLTVIPQNEIMDIGIPFVRSLIEKKSDDRQIEMWDEFWEYFVSYWVKIVGANDPMPKTTEGPCHFVLWSRLEWPAMTLRYGHVQWWENGFPRGKPYWVPFPN